MRYGDLVYKMCFGLHLPLVCLLVTSRYACTTELRMCCGDGTYLNLCIVYNAV